VRGWLLDTNVVAELVAARADARVLAWAGAQPRATVFVSVLTLGEYEQGIARLDPADPTRHRYEAVLTNVERLFAGRILPVDAPAARRWGRLSGARWRLRRQRPPAADLMLAAQAIEAGLYLATRDTRDVQGLGATVFNPWSDDPAAFPMSAR